MLGHVEGGHEWYDLFFHGLRFVMGLSYPGGLAKMEKECARRTDWVNGL